MDKPSLIGRDSEIKQLKDRYDQAEKGHGSIVFISGSKGVGKSSLIKYLYAEVLSKPPYKTGYAGVECKPNSKVALEVFLDLLTMPLLKGVRPEDVSERDRLHYEKLSIRGVIKYFKHEGKGFLFDVVTPAPLSKLAKFMNGVIEGAETENPIRIKSEAQKRKEEILNNFRKKSEETPLIFAIENFHNASDETLLFLTELVVDIKTMNILLLVECAGDVLHDRLLETIQKCISENENSTRIPVSEFSPLNMREYLEYNFPGKNIEEGFVNWLLHETKGNVETLDKLEWLRRLDDSIQFTDIMKIKSEESLEKMIETRMEELAPQAKTLLQQASMDGIHPSILAISKMAEKNQAQISSELESEVIKNSYFLKGPESNYTFGVATEQYTFFHPVIQTKFYNSIKSDIIRSHWAKQMVAYFQSIEEEIDINDRPKFLSEIIRYSEMAKDEYSIILYSLELASINEKLYDVTALRIVCDAAYSALLALLQIDIDKNDVSKKNARIKVLNQIAEKIKMQSNQLQKISLNLLLYKGRSLEIGIPPYSRPYYTEAEEIYQLVTKLADIVDDRKIAINAYLRLGFYYYWRNHGISKDAKEYFNKAYQERNTPGLSHAEKAKVSIGKAFTYSDSKAINAIDYYFEALQLANLAGNVSLQASANHGIGYSLQEANMKKDAIRHYEQALKLLGESIESKNAYIPFEAGNTYTQLGISLLSFAGKTDDARICFEKSIQAQKKVNASHIALPYYYLSGILVDKKKFSEARRCLLEVQELIREEPINQTDQEKLIQSALQYLENKKNLENKKRQ